MLRRIWAKGGEAIVPDKALVRAAMYSGAGAETLALIRPILFMVLIDRLITSASLDTISVLVLVLAVIAVLDAWLSYRRTTRLGEAAAVTFGDAAFRFWDRHQRSLHPTGRGEGSSAAADIIPKLYGAATAHCALRYSAVVDVGAAVLTLVILAMINPWMTLIIGGALPLVLANEIRSRKARDAVNAELVASSAGLRQRIDEMLQGHPSLITTGYSGFATSYIWGSLSSATGATVNQQRYQARTLRVSSLVQTISALVILLVGAGLVSAGILTIGALIAFDMLAGQLRAKVTSVIQTSTAAKDHQPTFDRVEKILEGRRPYGLSVKGGYPKNRVRISSLSFAYAAGPAIIDQLTWEFEGGKVYAVTGPSGAGKSTLGKLLAGVLVGEGVVEYELPEAVSNPVTYLPQDAWVFGGSLYDNILLLEPTTGLDEAALIRAETAAKAAGIKNLQSLISDPGEFGQRLSGGQRQRVHLARALANPTAVLVADEPSSALDSPLKATVAFALRQKAAEGAVVLIITHDEELIGAADVVLSIAHGKLEPLDVVLNSEEHRGSRTPRLVADSADGRG